MNLKIIKTDSPSNSESPFLLLKDYFYDSIKIKFWL